MAEDPLKSFRDRLTPRAPAVAPALVVNRGKAPYEAFAAKDKLKRCDIRCADGLAHLVSYNYLLNITYNRKTYSEVFLTVSGLTVKIKGKGLQPVIDALRMNHCEFIQEFDATEFLEPTDPQQPFIESIAVEVIRGPVMEKKSHTS